MNNFKFFNNQQQSCKRTRKLLNEEEKKKAINLYLEGYSHQNIAHEFSVARSTITKLLQANSSDDNKLGDIRKQRVDAKIAELEDILLERCCDKVVNDEIVEYKLKEDIDQLSLINTALEIAYSKDMKMFKGNQNWFNKFKKKHNLKFTKLNITNNSDNSNNSNNSNNHVNYNIIPEDLNNQYIPTDTHFIPCTYTNNEINNYVNPFINITEYNMLTNNMNINNDLNLQTFSQSIDINFPAYQETAYQNNDLDNNFI